ncbi:MAG: hypothetical protein ACLTTU_05970 [Bilophila wadsworthia]
MGEGYRKAAEAGGVPALWRRAVLPDGRRGFGRLGFRARQKTLLTSSSRSRCVIPA